jgi:transposase-like protein
MKKGYRIAPELKEQILARIKNDGVTVAQASADHGVSSKTIYTWLGARAQGAPSWSEFNKLKREKEELLRLIGDLTAQLSTSQKKKSA